MASWFKRLLPGKDAANPRAPEGGAQPQSQSRPVWQRIARATLILLILVMIAGVSIAAIYGPACAASLWALALISIGFFLGLLFALPRIWPEQSLKPPPSAGEAAPPTGGGESGTPAEPAQATSAPRPPDALLEIADWLTKIIVGLGLVNLRESPSLVSRLAAEIAKSLDATIVRAAGQAEWTAESGKVAAGIAERAKAGLPVATADIATSVQAAVSATLNGQLTAMPSYSVALAMALFFPTIGLLIGYLVTRMYLQTALVRGDREARDEASGHNDLPGANPAREYLESRKFAEVIAGDDELSPTNDAPPPEVANQLADLDAQYAHVSIADYRARVLQKNLLTQQMFLIAMRNKVSTGWLRTQGGDGYLHVLATAALADARPDIVGPLLDRARSAVQKHTKYRVVEAIKRLNDSGVLTDDAKKQAGVILSAYVENADQPLIARISDTRRALVQLPSAVAGGAGKPAD